MTGNRVYLDYNASAPLIPAARAAMVAAIDMTNPSSVHAEGRAARRAMEEARRDVATLVGAEPEHVVFTSGATEAANGLLTPDWRMGRGPLRMSRLFVSAADHPCILNGGRFDPEDIEIIGVDRNGVFDLAALESRLAGHDRSVGLPLVAVHAANNETGVVQPTGEVAAIVKAAGGILVIDAVQAAGRIPIDISAGYADFLILSSHKIGGPKGAGAIVSASDLMMPVPLITGGGQEKGHRSGTENVAAIAGFGAAAREALAGIAAMGDVAEMRGRFEATVLEIVPDAVIYGADAPRLPNTVYFSIPGMKAETAQIAFDLAGISISAGSACSSGKVGVSKVLEAMGFGDVGGALRISIGRDTSAQDLEAFGKALAQVVARLRARTEAA